MNKFIWVLIGVVAGSAVTGLIFFIFLSPKTPENRLPFQTNIIKAISENDDFRQVLFTGEKSQLVLMDIPPGGEVGQETHKYVEQTLYFQTGTGRAILDGKTTPVGPGDIVVVTPGTEHNFINTGNLSLKILVIYTPPNHIDGRIQHTIADEKADTADEAFGEAVR